MWVNYHGKMAVNLNKAACMFIKDTSLVFQFNFTEQMTPDVTMGFQTEQDAMDEMEDILSVMNGGDNLKVYYVERK